MICINCFNSKTKITNSRSPKKYPRTWRRHLCLECDFTFTTYEEYDLDELLLVSDGKKTADYNRGKLLGSIIRVLQPVGNDLADAYWLVKTIEQKLIDFQRTNRSWQPVTPKLLTELTHETLAAYNQAAGFSYAAAHGLRLNIQKARRNK